MSADPKAVIAAIEAALDVGPTPGPWTLVKDDLGAYVDTTFRKCDLFKSGDDIEVNRPSFGQTDRDRIDLGFVASANPDNLRTLLAYVRELEADAERMDWIERQPLAEMSFALVHDRPHDGEYEVATHGAAGYGKTLRAAIDAARDAACNLPPAGWTCTRGKGHEGPCAAVETPARPEAPLRHPFFAPEPGTPWWVTAKACGAWTERNEGDVGRVCFGSTEALRVYTCKIGDQIRAGITPTAAARDVLAERRRQVEVEGWTPEHDDQHADGQMAGAAACYARHVNARGWVCGTPSDDYQFEPTPDLWPWDEAWWKPSTPRRDLVKAAALILADIERIDRDAARTGGAKQ